MPRGKASGITLSKADCAIVLGMQNRGDRDHDIAGWFGVNQGRVAEVKDGRYGKIAPATAKELPPKGPPGVKGRRLRGAVEDAFAALKKGGKENVDEAVFILRNARDNYDSNER
jgi:hypothetical protein